MNASFKAIPSPLATHYKGYWEYLPASYASSPDKLYPTILFFAGIGEWGDGSLTGLQAILKHGLPQYIHNGKFPDVTVGLDGSQNEFIIICPQVDTYGYRNSSQTNTILNSIASTYRIDPKRIYVTGLSHGGGTVEQYVGHDLSHSQRVAAMAAVCGNQNCTSNDPLGVPFYKNVITANLPCAFFHNDQDPTVSYNYSLGWRNHLNTSAPAVVPPAILHTNHAAVHDAWTNAYNPAGTFAEFKGNVYQWLLQYTR